MKKHELKKRIKKKQASSDKPSKPEMIFKTCNSWNLRLKFN
jgi:hypothetical protein